MFKLSHRPHHISGDDDRGQISVTQIFTNGWRQSEREQKSVLYRYFNSNIRQYLR